MNKSELENLLKELYNWVQKDNKFLKINKSDLAFLAGVIESDGALLGQNKPGSSDPFKTSTQSIFGWKSVLTIQVTQSTKNIALLQKCQQIALGEGSIRKTTRQSNIGSPVTDWTLTKELLVPQLCYALLPYLSTKKKRAILLILSGFLYKKAVDINTQIRYSNQRNPSKPPEPYIVATYLTVAYLNEIIMVCNSKENQFKELLFEDFFDSNSNPNNLSDLILKLQGILRITEDRTKISIIKQTDKNNYNKVFASFVARNLSTSLNNINFPNLGDVIRLIQKFEYKN